MFGLILSNWGCFSQDVWDDPMTLFQFFKQPPNDEAAQMAIAGDIFECALGLVQDKVNIQFPSRSLLTL